MTGVSISSIAEVNHENNVHKMTEIVCTFGVNEIVNVELIPSDLVECAATDNCARRIQEEGHEGQREDNGRR